MADVKAHHYDALLAPHITEKATLNLSLGSVRLYLQVSLLAVRLCLKAG